MIHWYSKLYLDQRAKKNIEKLTSKIEEGKCSLGVYCVMFPSNSENLFDIVSTNELLFHHYKRNDMYILGIAYGKEHAISLVQQMVSDMYEEMHEINAKKFFRFQEG